MRRRIFAFLIGALLLCTAVLPCAAAQPASSVQQSVIHTEYGDIVVTTTLTVYDSAALSARLTHRDRPYIPVDISMSCTPSGKIS